MPRSILLGMLLCLTACTAPQGKKVAMNGSLPPVATGPSTKVSMVTLQNRGEIINVSPTKTLTVKLPSYNRDGYEWRLSEIPDPTVLKLVSQNFTPAPEWTKPGEQTLVFEATGTGEVPVKLWYGTLWASPMDATRPFEIVASVTPEEKKKEPAKSSAKKLARKTST